MRTLKPVTRQMRVAAKIVALADPSDPHAYGRTLANLQQGLDNPRELAEWGAKRLQLTTKQAVALAGI